MAKKKKLSLHPHPTPVFHPLKDWSLGENETGYATFIASGNFAGGHLAYSMLDDDGEEIDGEQTSYYQVRVNGRLVMVRI